MTNTNPSLRVFLCYSSNDKPVVRKLYDRLVNDGVDAWFDEKKLIPGQQWQIEIPKAVKDSHIVIVCLSSQSVTKEGFVQKEIRLALDSADEKPDEAIFIIPARLENCDVPERIKRFHWVDLFSVDGYGRLLQALQMRANSLGIEIQINSISNKNTSDSSKILPNNEFESITNSNSVRNGDSGLVFKTYRLENQEFLFTSIPWPFSVHSDGEDIKSKYTSKSERNQIVPRRGFSSQYPTIAAAKLVMEFFLKNTGGSVKYLEKLFLRVTARFAISEKMFWNTWMPMIAPHEFEVRIKPSRSYHLINFGGRLIEIQPENAEHFRVKIMGEKMNASQICEFELGAMFHDLENNSREVISERKYHIAFRV